MRRTDLSSLDRIVIGVALAGVLAIALSVVGVAHAQETEITGRGTVSLSWVAPTSRADGSPLTDLAGYMIYWGPESRHGRCSPDSPETIGADDCYPASFSVSDPAATGESFVLEFSETTTVYFAATAYDSAGRQSRYSNEAAKRFELVIHAPPAAPTSLEVAVSMSCSTSDARVTCEFRVSDPE